MMEFDALTEQSLQEIANAIRNRQYYLLLGAGVSTDSKGSHGNMLSGSDLAKKINESISSGGEFPLHQVYKLLNEKQIECLLTEPHYCTEIGITAGKIVEYNWRRIFTFNIDNCVEEASRKFAKDNSLPLDLVEFINYCDDFSENSHSKIQSIVHLHGFCEKSDDKYIFSHNDYVRSIRENNVWMNALTSLMASSPFIVAGTTLNEIDVEYYLNSRTFNTELISEFPSIIVEPYPNSLTMQLCRDRGFILFPGSLVEFFEKISTSDDEPMAMDLGRFKVHLPVEGVACESMLRFQEVFQKIDVNIRPEAASAKFLLGFPLSWGMIAGNSDIPRDCVEEFERHISEYARTGDVKSFVIFDDAGSGKTALLKRLAFRHAQRFSGVYWLGDKSFLDFESAATILNGLAGQVTVYVDDLADHAVYIKSIINLLEKEDVLFVGAERGYRRRFVEDLLNSAGDLAATTGKPLTLKEGEAQRLIAAHTTAGIGSISERNRSNWLADLKKVSGEPIAVANCRLQKNFLPFDKIIEGLIVDIDPQSLKFYTIVALGRYGCGAGVQAAIVFNACNSNIGDGSVTIDDVEGRLPVIRSREDRAYLLPGNSVVAERVLVHLSKNDAEFVANRIIDLGLTLAPYCHGRAKRRRDNNITLSAALLDYDRTVQKFAGGHYAEFVYSELENVWGSDGRFHEQIALMNFNTFLRDQTNIEALELATQKARFAEAQQGRPQSKTTLAKILFKAATVTGFDASSYFAEGFALILAAVNIEKNMKYVSSMPFTVLFRGVTDYLAMGRTLTPDQLFNINAMIQLTEERHMNDGQMIAARNQLLARLY